MPQSAFIVRVPEAEAAVGSLRERFDPSVRRGVPAHITVLFPFMSPELIHTETVAKVRAALQQVHRFDFRLEEIGRFPATAYLMPEPAAPFIALTQAIYQRFPEFPPNRGEYPCVVPHLTVANGDAEQAACAAEELLSRLQDHGPIHSTCHTVVLLENSSAQWQPMHEFALPQPAHGARMGLGHPR